MASPQTATTAVVWSNWPDSHDKNHLLAYLLT